MTADVLVIPTGVANVASVAAAFRRLGAGVRAADDPVAVLEARAVVLPGVGAFGAGMQRLAELGLVDALRRRLADGRPTLAICLGMQLLAASSEEAPAAAGLAVVPVAVRRFPPTVVVPQLGWNHVQPVGARMLEPGFAYFANSYRIAAMPAEWAVATTDHGGAFVSACERGAVLGCQFHPEISGRYGERLLSRWLDAVGARGC